MANTPEILLLNETQAAALLTVKIKTMQQWRGRGIGPAFIKLGVSPRSPVRYKHSELLSFVESGTVSSTAAQSVRCALLEA